MYNLFKYTPCHYSMYATAYLYTSLPIITTLLSVLHFSQHVIGAIVLTHMSCLVHVALHVCHVQSKHIFLATEDIASRCSLGCEIISLTVVRLMSPIGFRRTQPSFYLHDFLCHQQRHHHTSDPTHPTWIVHHHYSTYDTVGPHTIMCHCQFLV